MRCLGGELGLTDRRSRALAHDRPESLRCPGLDDAVSLSVGPARHLDRRSTRPGGRVVQVAGHQPATYGGSMSRPMFLGIGALLVIVGAVWFLQGIDVLGGSGMSGKTLWAVVGPIVALIGVGVGAVGLRRRT